MEIIIYILVLLVFGYFILRDIRNNDINAFNIFLLMALFAYIFVPTVVFIFGGSYQNKYEIIRYIFNSNSSERLKALLYIIIFTGFTVFVYNLVKPARNAMFSVEKRLKSRVYRKVRIYFVVLAAIGLAAFLYMVFIFGGITSLIQYAGSSRGEGAYKIASGSMLAYAIILSKAVLGSICPLIVLYELKPNKSTIAIGFILLCAGMIVLIYNAGKLPAIIFFLPMLLYFVDKKMGKKKKKTSVYLLYLLIGIVILFMMKELDNIFFFLRYGVFLSSVKGGGSILDTIMALINSFTYPFSNVLFADRMNGYFGMRFGIDYILPFINILPSRILRIVGLSEINTLYNQTSAYYSALNPLSKGGMPNDIITVAIRQLSVPGIIIIGSLVGFLLKLLDAVIYELNEMGNQFKFLIYTNYMVIVVFLFLEPYSAIMAYLSIIVLLFLTIGIHKLGSERRLQKMSLNREWCKK